VLAGTYHYMDARPDLSKQRVAAFHIVDLGFVLVVVGYQVGFEKTVPRLFRDI
jgi:hypothetical protein